MIDCLNDPFLREGIGGVLVEFGAAAVPALVASLSRKSEHTVETLQNRERRATCARLLGEIGDRRAIAALAMHVSQEEPVVRVAAALAAAGLDAAPTRLPLSPH